jgi:peptidoglycan/xylan/chitin deacetylase (PgdA/CDA1 family)
VSRPKRGPGLTVLTYHHVGVRSASCPLQSLTVSADEFARQMEWLRKRGYQTVNSAQWLAWIASQEALPRKPVLLTFDDAYADLETTALPIMEKYGFTGIVFAITQHAGRPTPWDGMLTMSREQLLRCAARGFEIGAHTRTHPDLAALDGSRMQEEIAGSRRDLEESGLRPVSFAYPFGSYNQAARDTVEGAFALAFTGREGRNNGSTDPLQMRRTMVLPCDTPFDFAARVALGWSPLGRIGAWFPLRAIVRNCVSVFRRRSFPREV